MMKNVSKYLWDAKPGFVPLSLKQTDQSSATGSLVSATKELKH